jgi:hypothetical protein
VDVGAGDAAVRDVPDDGDAEAVEVAPSEPLGVEARGGRSVMVRRSRSACVGCSWAPSPALSTTESTQRVRKWAAPGEAWRITTTSIFMASMFRAVSLRVSPFETEEPLAEKLTTSAESRFSASSNESRVRVLASKKRLTTVTPRRLGTRLMGRSSTSRNSRAVRRRRRISSAAYVASPRRWRWRRASAASAGASGTGMGSLTGPRRAGDEPHALAVVALPEPDADLLAGGGRDRPADEVWADRELAEAAVDEGEEADGGGAAEVHQRVERGAGGPPGVDHVVDEDDPAVVHGERDVGGVDDGLAEPAAEVVAVHRGVEDAEGEADPLGGLDLLAEPLGEVHPARLHPHEGEPLGGLGVVVEVLDDLAGEPVEGAVEVGLVQEAGLDDVLGQGRHGRGMAVAAGRYGRRQRGRPGWRPN